MAPFIYLRLRSRWERFQKLGIDDVVFIAAVLVALGYNATIAHMWNLGLSDWKAGYLTSEYQIVVIMQMVVPSSVLYVSASWAIKASAVLFYRIAAPPTSRIALACHVVLGGLFTSWLALFFYTLFGCRPYDKYWSRDPSCELADAWPLWRL